MLNPEKKLIKQKSDYGKRQRYMVNGGRRKERGKMSVTLERSGM